MARINLSERIKNAPLVLDGAMGTELIGRVQVEQWATLEALDD